MPSFFLRAAAMFLLMGCTPTEFDVAEKNSAGNSTPTTTTPPPGPGPSPSPAPWGTRTSANIFFTGHSLMDNPLPEFVEEVAQKKADTIRWNEQIIIGSPLRIRTKNNYADMGWPGYSNGKNRGGTSGLNIINELLSPQTIGASNLYDVLVVTERHDMLPVIEWEDTIGFLRHYHDRFIAGNSSGQSYFYHPWWGMDKSNPQEWITYEKAARSIWECVVVKVNQSLQAAGRNDRMKNMPVSTALVDLIERLIADQVAGITGNQLARINAIMVDNVHLTDLGAYYAALVTYAAIYGKTPHGITAPASLNATASASLQQIAWNFVDNYYSQTNVGVHTPAQCRTLAVNIVPLYNSITATNQGTSFWSNNTTGAFKDANFTPHPAP